jgi:hypothetical protein
MSKRRWAALATLLTFWPPGPCARIALISTSSGGTVKRGRMRVAGFYIRDLPTAQAVESVVDGPLQSSTIDRLVLAGSTILRLKETGR